MYPDNLFASADKYAINILINITKIIMFSTIPDQLISLDTNT